MKHIASIIVIVCLLALAAAAAPASAQWVKGQGAAPNPIREYGKLTPTQWVKGYKAGGGGAHRAQ